MRMFRTLAIAVLVATTSTGCIVHASNARGRNSQPARSTQQMTYGEAVDRARDYAISRGYRVLHVDDAHLTGNDVWKVKLEVDRPGAHGKIHLDYNAWSRALIRADEKVKARHGHDGTGPGRGNYHPAQAVSRD